MCRWTNILPDTLNNLRLIEKDSAYIQDSVKTWYEMKADYEAHNEDGQFEHAMSPIYGDHPFLAPVGYGLVVVDMVNNQILDYQGYTSIGRISSVSIRSDITENECGGHTLLYIGPEERRPKQKGVHNAFNSDDEYSAAMRFRKLYEAGRIPSAIDQTSRECLSLDGKSLDQIAEMIMSKKYYTFPIAMSPFQITEYREHDARDAVKMREKIEELGFTLSSKEKNLWAQWIETRS